MNVYSLYGDTHPVAMGAGDGMATAEENNLWVEKVRRDGVAALDVDKGLARKLWARINEEYRNGVGEKIQRDDTVSREHQFWERLGEANMVKLARVMGKGGDNGKFVVQDIIDVTVGQHYREFHTWLGKVIDEWESVLDSKPVTKAELDRRHRWSEHGGNICTKVCRFLNKCRNGDECPFIHAG